MIAAVSRDRLWAVTDAGEVCPIVKLFDIDGDETLDHREAIAAVAENGGLWFAIRLDEFDSVTLH